MALGLGFSATVGLLLVLVAPRIGRADLVCDLLTGPLLLRMLMPSLGPVDDAMVAVTVASALDAVRFRAAGATRLENP